MFFDHFCIGFVSVKPWGFNRKKLGDFPTVKNLGFQLIFKGLVFAATT